MTINNNNNSVAETIERHFNINISYIRSLINKTNESSTHLFLN